MGNINMRVMTWASTGINKRLSQSKKGWEMWLKG
jgi:hypothetical protein